MNSSPPNSVPSLLGAIFQEACQRSNPTEHTRKYIKRSKAGMHVGDRVYGGNTRIWLLACGKAAAAQARAVVEWAGQQLEGALVITPTPIKGDWPGTAEFLVATHPNPSASSEKAANRALSFCEAIEEADLLVCAISGGTSALLAAPRTPLSLDEKSSINEELLRSGADIQSVNLVRQQLSWIKGGALASATKGTVETLVFSDIETPHLDLVGSGPTLINHSPPETILATWLMIRPLLNLSGSLLEKCDQLMRKNKEVPVSATCQPPILCASPQTLKEIASEIAREKGFVLVPTSSATYGTKVPDLVKDVVEVIQDLKATCTETGEGRMAIWVREPVLQVSRFGNGGRNSHLALLIARELKAFPGVTFLAAGSDGVDGSSKFAGAVVTSDSWQIGISQGLNPERFLSQFDSADFHAEIGTTIFTGPTGTNLTDLHLLWVEP